MKYIYIVLCIILFGSCTINRISKFDSKDSFSTARSFGAIPNDGKDDTESLQRALDTGFLDLEQGTYQVSRTLFLNQNGSRITSRNLAAILNFVGTGPCLSMKRANGNYLVNCIIENFAITLNRSNSIAIEFKASHSVVRNLRVGLKNNDCIGLLLVGDSKGTGPYYNSFYNCTVQGSVQSGKRNQKGVMFTSSNDMPTRCPNANSFFGGRIGQTTIAYEINGNGNNFYSPTVEGSVKSCFYFDHKSSSVGCVSNNVYSPYIEGARGVVVAYYGVNAINCQILNPYVTSIGLEGSLIQDISKSQNNGLILSEDVSKTFSRQIIKKK